MYGYMASVEINDASFKMSILHSNTSHRVDLIVFARIGALISRSLRGCPQAPCPVATLTSNLPKFKYPERLLLIKMVVLYVRC